MKVRWELSGGIAPPCHGATPLSRDGLIRNGLWPSAGPVWYAAGSMTSPPLGARLTADGADFALFSPHGQRAWVCLFDDQGEVRHELSRQETIFQGHVAGVRAGTRYGFRVE